MVTDFFIKIDGVDGESNEKSHTKWIEVIDFSHGSVQNIALGKAHEVSGRGQFTPFTFTHVVDKATPKLQNYCMTGQKINKEEFQKKLLDHFFENYELFMQQGFTFIKIDYLQRTKFIGKKIYISSENNKKTEYIAKSINDDGSLLVTDNQKKEIILYSGDLSF